VSFSCKHYMWRGHEIVEDTIPVSGKRNSPHGINDMFVKSREKSEAVLTRKGIVINSGVLIRNRNASRFSTREPDLPFEDLYIKPPFNYLMCCTHSRYPAAENNYFGHTPCFGFKDRKSWETEKFLIGMAYEYSINSKTGTNYSGVHCKPVRFCSYYEFCASSLCKLCR